jgi:uncharacterized membrane protein YeiH
VADWVAQSICAITVIGLRIAAVRFGWSLPILKVDEKSLPDE